MRCSLRSVVVACAGLLVAGRAIADLPEPPVNEGATSAEVEGTTLHAEAWARGRGHAVEAIVVARLDPSPAPGKPRVATYERWTLDGRTKAEQGDKKLGAEWSQRLGAILDEAAREARASGDPLGGGKPKEGSSPLERLERLLGPTGSRSRDGWTVGWSIGVGESQGDAGRSSARTAVFTLRPSVPTPPPPPSDEDAPKGDVTPGDGSPERGLRERHGLGPVPSGTGTGAASGSARSDGASGARAHAKVTVDLAGPPEGPATPPGNPPPPGGDVTPPDAAR